MNTTAKINIENKYEASVFLMGAGISLGAWDCETTFTAYCYGMDGDEPGEVPVSVAKVEQDGEEIGWAVAETPDECTNIVAIMPSESEAREKASEYADAEDETAA